MPKKSVLLSTIAAACFFTLSVTAFAAMPAPPVNQLIGIPDTVFGQMFEADCRICHGPNPPAGVADIIDTTLVPDRHHNLINETIPAVTVAPGGTPGDIYECVSCHSLVWNEADQMFVFATFRDCTACHSGGSPHHSTAQAQSGDCQTCHGSLVDNGLLAENQIGGVPKWLPSYNPSQITPWPSNKDVAGTNGEGSCYFCHGQPSGTPGNSVIDPASGVRVYTPQATHHGTGLNTSDKCGWCHYEYTTGPTSVTTSAQSIRTCQNCHGIPSLHNIQYVPEGQTLVPGQMSAWYGHIGANSDCFGCHGFTRAQSLAPQSGPIVPQIDGLSRRVFMAGADTELTVFGNNFVNSYAPMAGLPPVEYSSIVVLRDPSGHRYELAPHGSDAKSIQVVVPADLPVGNYQVVAQKRDKLSNPETLVIKPQVAIDSAQIRAEGYILVSGQGFGPAPPLATGLGVTIEDAPAAVLAWSDRQILVEAGRAAPGQTLKVLSTYSVSATLSGAGSVPPDETSPRGKKGKSDLKKNQGKKVR